MALKEFKRRMLPSAPSSTLTVMLSIPLWCGHFNCKTVRILVLPSGSVSLLMLATDFNLEMVENDCLRKSVLPKWSWKELVPWRFSLWFPWRSPISPWRSSVFSPWRSSEWSWKEADCAVGTFGCRLASRPGTMWLTSALTSSGCATGFSVPSSWLLRPTLCTEMFLLPHLWHFLPHAGHSLGGWDVPHLPHILPLLFGLDLSCAWRSWSHLLWLPLQLLHWTSVSRSP